MHQSAAVSESDSMQLFRMGVEGGRPAEGATGVQPEWFYKGDGGIIAAPGADIPVPDFALDAGEEPEIVGIYLIDGEGRPCRLGFAIGNEFSDHVTERQSYLYLAHSKLRFCSFGPELRTGPLPSYLAGTSAVLDGAGNVRWSAEFLNGEADMSHSLRNLEAHHFKYSQFRRPWDLHLHDFGTATLSFAAGITVEEGQGFAIHMPEFGRPLVNRVRRAAAPNLTIIEL